MTSSEAPTFCLKSTELQVTAQMREGKFVVLAGSQARSEPLPSLVGHSYSVIRTELIQSGKLVGDGLGALRYTEDVPFSKPSGAAAVTLGRPANGLLEWLTVPEEGHPSKTYRAWLEERDGPLPPSVLDGEDFEPIWQPFFHELAVALLAFEDRQPELVQILRDAGVHIGHDEGAPLVDLDPFSFFSLILKFRSDARVAEVFGVVKLNLNLKEDVPTELTGVPWSNPMNAWFFAYRSQRQVGDVPTLWQLAREAMQGELQADTFARALAIRKVALPKLTTGLFWLNSQAFLALNGVNVPYLERRGVPGAGKVQTLEQYQQVLQDARPLAPDFPTLSHRAWLATQPGRGIAELIGEAFPFRAFQNEALGYAADTAKGNMLLDRNYGQLLLSLLKDETFEHLTPSRSPYSGTTQLAVKIGLGNGPRADAGPFARGLLFPQESDAEYVAYAPGLTLEAGVPDGRSDDVRSALRSPDVREGFLRALLSLPDGTGSPVFNLNSDFPDVGPLSLLGGEDTTRRLLDAYVGGQGKSRRLQVGVTLTPEALESQDFPDTLAESLTYLDGVMAALTRVVQVAEINAAAQAQMAPTIQAPGTVTPVPQPGFIPTPGVPLNQILYGPPGTGKTYQIVNRVLSVLDPAILQEHAGNRVALKARYDELVAQGQVSFVTFHQSFGYEDFIEGIKPVMQAGQLSYVLEDGVFLHAVRAAGGSLPHMREQSTTQHQVSSSPELNPAGQVWRLYIDGTVPVSQVRERSVSRGEIRIGSWLGESSTVNGRPPAASQQPADLSSLPEEQVNAQQHAFKDSIRTGDLILLATGQDRIGAVGVVTGEYRFDPHSDAVFALDYAHVRPVRWLATGLSLRAQDVTGKLFAPPTLQRVVGTTPSQVLTHLPNGNAEPMATGQSQLRPHVLIIDEINRGNVAKIFGELITLLEDGKRTGADEALSVTLPLSRRPLSVPRSLYVIGTMNTADRSLTLLDAALRRRFVFHPVWPAPEVLPVLILNDGVAIDLRKLLYAINTRIERLLSREQMIGHAYLLGLPATLSGVASALRERILPLLEEYFFDDWNKIRTVFDDDAKPVTQQFVVRIAGEGEPRYQVNEAAFAEVEAFTLVYSRMADTSFPFSS